MTAYLDHAATSPLRPEALAAMLPHLTEHFGNPSGSHAVARGARAAVEDARESVAARVGAEPAEVVFTAGGTESCNLAVLGAWRRRGGSVVCSGVEHDAVLRVCAATGAAVTVPVNALGTIDLDALAEALHPGVALVSLMLANNETGVVQPLRAAADLVRRRAPRALLHTDAVGAGAWLDLAEWTADADLVSVGGHKFGGPKGVGALVVRRAARLEPVLHGGPQERGRRPGTHDVAGIVGMAAALEVAARTREEEAVRVAALRDRLAEGLLAQPGVSATVDRHGGRPALLPGTCHLLFEGVAQEELLVLLDQGEVCASAGAACASGALAPSHVLLAMGVAESAARGAVRFSLGWSSTSREVEHALEVVPKALAQLRGTH